MICPHCGKPAHNTEKCPVCGELLPKLQFSDPAQNFYSDPNNIYIKEQLEKNPPSYFIQSVISAVLFYPLGLLACLFSVMSLILRKAPNPKGSRRLGHIAKILSISGIAAGIIMGIIMLIFMSDTQVRRESRSDECRTMMRIIATSVEMYNLEHESSLKNFSDEFYQEYFKNSGALKCPEGGVYMLRYENNAPIVECSVHGNADK